MKINGVSFNHEWAKGKTEDEFVKEFKDHAHIFPESKDKVADLKAAYATLKSTPLQQPGASAPKPTSISNGVSMTVK